MAYDDHQYVRDNLPVRAGLSVDSLRWALSSFYASNWHPITWVSHMLDVQAFGLSPAGHHATSLLLHGLNAGLLVMVLRRLSGCGAPLAGCLAMLFALHPLRVQSVAWVAERKDVLSGAFFLLCLLSHLHAQQTPLRRALTTGWLSLGLMSKPTLVTLPFLLILIDAQRASPLGRPWLGELWNSVRAKWFWLLMAAAVSVLTRLAQTHAVAPDIEAFTLQARMGNALVSIPRYLGKTLWPESLAVFYPWVDQWPAWAIVASLVALVALTWGAFRMRASRPLVLLGWLWFIGTLVPTLGLVKVGEQSIADRYTYLPHIGLCVCLAGALHHLGGPPKRITAVLAGLGVLLALGLLSPRTRREIGYYRDDLTLFLRATQVTERNGYAETNVGAALAQLGRLEEANEHFFRAAEYTPRSAIAVANIGNTLMMMDKPEEALAYLAKAAELNPTSARAHVDWALALLRLGRPDKAIERLHHALSLAPGDSVALKALADANRAQIPSP